GARADRAADQGAGEWAHARDRADDGARARADAAAGDGALAPSVATGRGAEQDGGEDDELADRRHDGNSPWLMRKEATGLLWRSTAAIGAKTGQFQQANRTALSNL